MEDIKKEEISTKKEWENIVEKVEKGVDNNPIKTYIVLKAPGYEP